MFVNGRNKDNEWQSRLDAVIENLLIEMQVMVGTDEEYPKMVDLLTKLYKLKEQDAPKRISPETWATIGGNLAAILLILNFERAGVITSKALAFVPKLFR